jgi:hypothetical protein
MEEEKVEARYQSYVERKKSKGEVYKSKEDWLKQFSKINKAQLIRQNIIDTERKLPDQQLQREGYFSSSLLNFTESDKLILSNTFFKSQSFLIQKQLRTELVSGYGWRNVIFRNIENKEIPTNLNLGSSVSTTTTTTTSLVQPFLNLVQKIFNNWKELSQIKSGYKVGGCEYIDYINSSSTEVYGQMRHLDAIENSSVNRYGIFLPVLFNTKQAGEGIVNIGPVGTRIVKYSNFQFNQAPNIPQDAWFFDSPTTNIDVDYTKYACVVVNKVPHGGGKQLPFSRRITLFLYIVPTEFQEDILTSELETTISALYFLMKSHRDDNGIVDINSFKMDEEVKKWVRFVKGSHQHFSDDLKLAQMAVKNSKDIIRAIKDLSENEGEIITTKRRKL